MEKKVAKIFKKYGNKKIEVLKKYRAKSFEQGQTTTAIKGTRMHLNETIAHILISASQKERDMVANCLVTTYREDWEEGKAIKY